MIMEYMQFVHDQYNSKLLNSFVTIASPLCSSSSHSLIISLYDWTTWTWSYHLSISFKSHPWHFLFTQSCSFAWSFATSDLLSHSSLSKLYIIDVPLIMMMHWSFLFCYELSPISVFHFKLIRAFGIRIFWHLSFLDHHFVPFWMEAESCKHEIKHST